MVGKSLICWWGLRRIGVLGWAGPGLVFEARDVMAKLQRGGRGIGVGVVAAWCGVALGSPRESVTFTNVVSDGELSTPLNTVRTQAFAGGYAATRLRVTGTLNSG